MTAFDVWNTFNLALGVVIGIAIGAYVKKGANHAKQNHSTFSK
ncbi:hypothetical protein [Apilactobacillus nanyangensis]|nr:hypothetical protein [Apilactobacillus nanyangensis]